MKCVKDGEILYRKGTMSLQSSPAGMITFLPHKRYGIEFWAGFAASSEKQRHCSATMQCVPLFALSLITRDL